MMLASEFSHDFERKSVLFCLETLKELRSYLIQDFLQKSREIYLPSFKFERNEYLLEQSINKYFLVWSSRYWLIVESAIQREFSNLDQEKRQVQDQCAHIFLKLLENMSEEMSNRSLGLAHEILEKNIQFLTKLIATGDISNKTYDELSYLHHRDKALFEREFDKLKA